MPDSVIAAQLYTVRAFAGTPGDLARTLRRIKQIGYEAVQVSGVGAIEPGELAGMLRGEGLVCCATHEPFEAMRDKTEEVLEKHRVLGCRYSAVGVLPMEYRNRDGYRRFAREYSEVARRMKAGGLEVGYHNHHWEFEKFDGRAGLRMLIEECDPAAHFEIDTYWVQAGGGDPAEWVRKVAGRVPLVHLKDMVYGRDDTTADGLKRNTGESEEQFKKRQEAARGPKAIMAEVGEGNMNWPGILRACGEAGVRWYIVEQDVCQRDPFESLAISLRNVRGMGLQ